MPLLATVPFITSSIHRAAFPFNQLAGRLFFQNISKNFRRKFYLAHFFKLFLSTLLFFPQFHFSSSIAAGFPKTAEEFFHRRDGLSRNNSSATPRLDRL